MKYYTKFLVNTQIEEFINKLNFKKIQLSSEIEPTGKNFHDIDCNGFTSYTFRQEKPKENSLQSKLLIIETEKDEFAEDFLSVLIASCYMISPELFLNNLFNELYELNDNYYNKDYIDTIKPNFNYFNGLKKALEITQYCFEKEELVYALEKFKLSRTIYSLDIHSANPKYGDLFEKEFINRSSHTEQAFAIISAFSVIEELGLEIRSSNANPRFIDNISGEWNPKVLNEIKNRLLNANISDEDNIDWIFRGNESEIEKILKPYFGVDSIWCEYENVRDKTLTFPEAIHNASYLRNFIASHKFNKLSKYINPYDVLNVQNLARQLFLKKIGFWKI